MAATTITINDETPRRQYTATSGQTVFDFPIPFFEDEDLKVYWTRQGNTPDDAADLLTLTTDYTVTGANTQDGGYITLTSNASNNDVITIIRSVSIDRTSDYQAAGDLLAETLNREQDEIIMIAQQLQEELDRTVKLQATSTGSIEGLVEDLEIVANKIDEIDVVATDLVGANFDLDAAYDMGNIGDAPVGVQPAPNGYIITVYNSLTDIETVATDIADVNTVAADIADVTTVATDIADVSTVATDLGGSDNIGTVAANIADVSAVAAIDADVTTVAGIGADLATVAGIDADISTVAGISADITSVAGLSADLATVAGDSADIGTVSGISSDVTAVSGISSDVTAVSGISADVTTVAGDSANIGTVAGISADVSTVSGVSSDVSTVSGISADVSTVAGDSSNIGTVSTNIADVSSVATALTGDPSGGSLVSYSNSSSGLTATNTQEALDEIVGFVPNVNTANTFTGTQTFEGDVEINGTVDAGGLS